MSAIRYIANLGDGVTEIGVGSDADAQFVRGTFAGVKGSRTTEPENRQGDGGYLWYFHVSGTEADPLTTEKARRLLGLPEQIEAGATTN